MKTITKHGESFLITKDGKPVARLVPLWGAEVWFATSSDYRRVASFASREQALIEARGYWDDSRGIRLVAPDGSVEQLKGECAARSGRRCRGTNDGRARIEASCSPMNVTLWRAADDDYVPDAASFARRRVDAEAYFDNRGFGGAELWKARVRTSEARVLNLYAERDPVSFVVELLGIGHHPGAIGIEEWIPMRPEVQAGLHDAGYDWVIVLDSFPEGAETWLWIGPFEREPELEMVPRTGDVG